MMAMYATHLAGQQAAAARAGLELRQARAEIRRGLRRGNLDIHAIVTDPPDCLHGLNLHEVVAWTRGMSRIRLEAINRKACHSGINLMVRVERASTRTREWVGEHVTVERLPTRGRAHLGHGNPTISRPPA